MNRYRNVPGLRGPSKAAPNTLCQKCLKRDTFLNSYECKVAPQERPYTSRPSRTQQLANPKLLQPLSHDLLEESPEINSGDLGRKEEELRRTRETTRKASPPFDPTDSKPRSPSVSSYRSSSSVSTISTSRSRSPPPKRQHSMSPAPLRADDRKRKAKRSPSSESLSSYDDPSETHSTRNPDRRTRRKWQSRSPDERGRYHDSEKRSSRRDKSRSQSRDRSRIARERRSITPAVNRNGTPHQIRTPTRASRDSSQDQTPFKPRTRHRERSPMRGREGTGTARATHPPQRQSLSPFSKRLALTQAMNLGK